MKKTGKVKNILDSGQKLVCIGPVSKNTVDATIEFSNYSGTFLKIIASRSQIEMDKLGGGYCNKWNTSDFADYIRKKDKRNRIIIARDHGGAYQHPLESSLSTDLAMKSSMESFACDIESGFDAIHFDPMIPSTGNRSEDILQSLKAITEIYDFCHTNYPSKVFDIEIGTEEQTPGFSGHKEIGKLLKDLTKIIKDNSWRMPTLLVVQTGTKVIENQNLGLLNTSKDPNKSLEKINFDLITSICQDNGIYTKGHNIDYINEDALISLSKFNLSAVNIAPEFGHIESKAIWDLLNKYRLDRTLDDLIEYVTPKNKWRKWTLKPGEISDQKKFLLGAHYHFSDDEFVELLNPLKFAIETKSNTSLDEIIKNKIKDKINFYINTFGAT